MQIKSYILVRVTEALKSVSGLHGQRGFFCVVSRTEASTPPMWELTFRAAQFRRGWGGHPASLARGARAACSAVGTRQLVARRGPGMPPRWLGGGQQQRARGFWHLQTSPHKHTAVISSSADHILVVMREADVRHVSWVAEVTLMFGKFFCAWKIKELH